jgi:hypothetical protein
MKLTDTMVEQTLGQFEARPLPEDHPVRPELVRLFGDHTFFLDNSGLHVVEPTDDVDAGSRRGEVLKIASWQDSNFTSLAPHRPEPIGVSVELEDAA